MCKFIDSATNMADARDFYTEMLKIEATTTHVTVPPATRRKETHGDNKAQAGK